jgi:hypothetical protein
MRFFKLDRSTGTLDISNGSSPDAPSKNSISASEIVYARISRNIISK